MTAATVLLLLALAVPAAAAEDGAEAPEGLWLTDGGCASRSGVTSTLPLRGPVVTAWTTSVKGKIEGDVLVVGRRALVCVGSKAARRSIHFLRLSDGEILGSERLAAKAPLLPGLGNGHLVVRAGPKAIEGHRLRRSSLVRFWRVDFDEPVHALLVHEREVYVRFGGSIARYDVGRHERKWVKKGEFLGRLALRGDHVYVLSAVGRGAPMLQALGRHDGAEAASMRLRYSPRERPDPADDWPRLEVHENRVVVLHGSRLKAKNGLEPNATFVARKAGPGGAVELKLGEVFEMKGGTVPWKDAWVGSHAPAHLKPMLVRAPPTGRQDILATEETHPDLFREAIDPSRARGVIHLGARTFDLEDGRLLWWTDVRVDGRPVPARGLVLVPTAGSRIAALREAVGKAEDPWLFKALQGKEAAFTGRLVLADGAVVSDSFERSGRFVKARRSRWTLEEIDLFEDGKGRIRLAAGPRALRRGLEALADHEVGRDVAALAVEAGRAGHAALFARLLDEAYARGLLPEELEEAEAQRAQLEQRAAGLTDDRRTELEAKAKTLAASAAGRMWNLRERLDAEAPPWVRFELLRAVLDQDPAHEAAIAELKPRLPANVTRSRMRDPRAWLDLLGLGFPVEFVLPPRKEEPGLPPVRRMLGAMRAAWKRSLIGVRSPRVLVVAGRTRPRDVARCLVLGELVGEMLEETFGAPGKPADEVRPVLVQLCDDEQDYMQLLRSRVGGGLPRGDPLQWPAGHYSPLHEAVRLHLPNEDDGFRRVQSAVVHELTHQWMQERCPRLGGAGQKRSVVGKGYWVVEGMACVIADFDFDLEARSWRYRPSSMRFDTAVNMPRDARIPWGDLIGMSRADFEALDDKRDLGILPRLGIGQLWASRTHVFYAQSAVAASFLFHAEEGKWRAGLLDYVAAHYRGEEPDVEEVIGLPPDEIGKRALEWARDWTAR